MGDYNDRMQFFHVKQDIPELGIRQGMQVIANFDAPPIHGEFVLARFGGGWTAGLCQHEGGKQYLAARGVKRDLATAAEVAAIQGQGWFEVARSDGTTEPLSATATGEAKT